MVYRHQIELTMQTVHFIIFGKWRYMLLCLYIQKHGYQYTYRRFIKWYIHFLTTRYRSYIAVLNSLVLKPEYFIQFKPIPLLIMAWRRKEPCHEQELNWFRTICKLFSLFQLAILIVHWGYNINVEGYHFFYTNSAWKGWTLITAKPLI